MRTKEQFSILIVDDDPVVVRLLHTMLDDFTPLRFATSGQIALRQAREAAPDLMLLDVELPDMSGFDVCRTLKTDPMTADIAVVFSTVHDDDELKARGLQLGAADFITKPPNAALVQAVVRAQQRAKKKLTDTMRNAVSMDFLTGCANRLQFEKTLTQEWLRAQRSKSRLVLVLADLVDFKDFNAQYGESAGDACLQRVAEVLRSLVRRPADLIARYSGGKFALLLPDTHAEGAGVLAQRACAAVAELQLDASPGAKPGSITMHCGIACADWRATHDDAVDCRVKSRLAQMSDKQMLSAAEQALECVRRSSHAQVAQIDLCRYSEGGAAIELPRATGT